MRWLFHVVKDEDFELGPDGRYGAGAVAREGFLHASYKDRTLESAALYFEAGARLRVLAIDPRRLDVPVRVVETPRGPMPHVHGTVPMSAVRMLSLSEVEAHEDVVASSPPPPA